MKLPIKEKYFNQIKAGEKIYELRDAHITFICEETGERMRREVLEVSLVPRRAFPAYSDVLEDEVVIMFRLSD